MTDLWVGNVKDDTSDDEIREFLVRDGFPAFDGILRVEGKHPRFVDCVQAANSVRLDRTHALLLVAPLAGRPHRPATAWRP
jgi:hypothetical protein